MVTASSQQKKKLKIKKKETQTRTLKRFQLPVFEMFDAPPPASAPTWDRYDKATPQRFISKTVSETIGDKGATIG